MSNHARASALKVTFALLAFVFSAQLLSYGEQSRILAEANILSYENFALAVR